MELDVLGKIWGDRSGYVFLPWIAGTARSKVQRKRNYHEGKAFHWPKDKELIREHLSAHTQDELYFTPALFRKPDRKAYLVMEEERLWADLDEADPNEIEDKYRPTIAWQTSPGRYQAVWVLTEGAAEASMDDAENQRLSHHVGADPSGWDTTQLLRVPGSRHHKNSEKGVPGKLLWDDGPEYEPEAFADLPPVPGAQDNYALLDEELLEDINRHEVWARIRIKLNSRILRWMDLREIDDDSMDRSEVAWQIERELADAGCSLAEIVSLMRPTVWNKYAGRNDELKRLKVEAGKAIAARDDKDDDALEVIEELPEFALVDFKHDTRITHAPRPRWLIKGFVPEGACGFMSASPKSMKSWMALDMAFALSSRTDFFGVDIYNDQNVLYIQEEDPPAMVKERLRKIADGKEAHWEGTGVGISKSRKFIWDPPVETRKNLYMLVRQGVNMADPAWHSRLKDLVSEYKIGLVVLDTLATVAPGVDIDKGTEIKERVLDPLKNIASQFNCAMLIVHHNKKTSQPGSAANAAANMSGSVQIHAWTEFGIYITEKKDIAVKGVSDLRFIVETKHTITKYHKFRIALVGKSILAADDDSGEVMEEGVWDPEEQFSFAEGDADLEPKKKRGREPKDYTELRGKIDKLREIEPGITQMTIAERLGISQPQVSTVLRKTRDA